MLKNTNKILQIDRIRFLKDSSTNKIGRIDRIKFIEDKSLKTYVDAYVLAAIRISNYLDTKSHDADRLNISY